MWTWFMNKSAVDLQSDVSLVLAGAGVPTFRQHLPRMSAELDRARRYQRVLTMAVFSIERTLTSGGGDLAAPTSNSADALWAAHVEPVPTAADGFLPIMLACVLREAMRETDIVTYASTQSRCIVAMPEVDTEEARRAVRRLHDLATRRLTSPVRAGIAIFPHDGVTLGELLRCADERAQRAVQGPHLVDTAGGAASLSFR